MISCHRMWRAAFAASAILFTQQVGATVIFTIPNGATDMHFAFQDGQCTALRLLYLAPEIWPHDGSITAFGCNAAGEAHYDFKQGQSGPYSLTLPDVFKPDDPALKDKKGGKVVIKNAWWTPSKDVFFRDYVVVVPEPASWALLITGFGLVGGVLRRRRIATA